MNTLQGGAQRGAALHDAAKLADGDAGPDGQRAQPLALDVVPHPRSGGDPARVVSHVTR